MSPLRGFLLPGVEDCLGADSLPGTQSVRRVRQLVRRYFAWLVWLLGWCLLEIAWDCFGLLGWLVG